MRVTAQIIQMIMLLERLNIKKYVLPLTKKRNPSNIINIFNWERHD